MAAIDYGVMCFLGGQQIYKDKLYPNIEFHGATINCYKYGCTFSLNGEEVRFYGVSEQHRFFACRKIGKYKVSSHAIHIKEICERVYKMTVSANGDHLTIIYGYGVDNNMRIWNKVKKRYLGKKRAKIVDKEIAKAVDYNG